MAEVAGLVLAVVPIVLEALKAYETLYRTCKRFKKWQEGVEELIHCLGAQKVIFRNETRLLLAGALGADTANDMLNDLENHHLWRAPLAMERVACFLGDSKEAITSTAQDISRKLKRFEDEMDKLHFDDTPRGPQDRSLKKEAKSRFRYVFTESKIVAMAESVAKLTKRYRALRSQLQELAVVKVDPESSSRTVQASLERLTTTQAAAKRVYEVLAISCKLHTKHHARFSLSPQYSSSPMGVEIKFQIAYRHLSQQQAQGNKDVLWFVVESVLYGMISAIPPPMSSSNKRPASPTLVTIHGAIQTQKKRVKFRSPSPEVTPPTKSPVVTSSPALPDLGGNTDFCTQLRACCRNKHTSGTCIGWLKSSSQWKHRVYQSQGPEQAVLKEAESLATVLALARSPQNLSSGVPLLQRLRLAKVLTSAILNFHATPWMQSCWRSNDIFLYDFSHASNKLIMKEPDAFVEVPVHQQLLSSPDQDAHALAPYVRNPVLFNLAVTLLELAFEKPLQDMIAPCDAKPGTPAVTIEYHAAVRLSKEVSAHLGPRYSQIVEQCLFCAFGQGTELSNPALQSAIQHDVVSELDRLANGFQQLLIS